MVRPIRLGVRGSPLLHKELLKVSFHRFPIKEVPVHFSPTRSVIDGRSIVSGHGGVFFLRKVRIVKPLRVDSYDLRCLNDHPQPPFDLMPLSDQNRSLGWGLRLELEKNGRVTPFSDDLLDVQAYRDRKQPRQRRDVRTAAWKRSRIWPALISASQRSYHSP